MTKTNKKNQAGEQPAEQLAKQRAKYAEIWDSHIAEARTLAFCSDEELSKEVRDAIETLRALVPKVAELKTSFSGWAFEEVQ